MGLPTSPAADTSAGPRDWHRPWRVRVQLGVVFWFVLASAAAGQQPQLKDLARKAKPSVVQLKTFDALGQENGSGTGFFVTAGGWLVTNHHVIDGASSLEAQLDDLSIVSVRGLLAQDVENDLAVLQVDVEGVPALPLASASLDVEVGERVVVLGGPLGLASTLSEGIVSAVRRTGDPALDNLQSTPGEVLQITASISPGSSGSPVINPVGEVIGVVVSQFVIGQNLNFAIPVEPVHRLLASIDPSAPARSFGGLGGGGLGASGLGSGFLRNVLISAVFFGLIAFGYRRWLR